MLRLIKNSKSKLVGFACIIDRSNKKQLKIKKKIISQVKLNIPTYKKIIYQNIKKNPVTSPGSRRIKMIKSWSKY